MKITDMTDTAFDQAMQRLLGDVQFWCIRLSQIGEYSLEPMPVSYADGSGKQPFPLALEVGTMRRVANPGQKRSRRLSRISVSFSGPIPAAVVTISRLRFGTSHWALCANWHGRVKH